MTHRVSCVHVVSTEGEPVGVVTIQDLCRALITAEMRLRGVEAERQTRQENASAMKIRK